LAPAQGSAFGEGKRLQKYVNRKKLVILVLVASKNNTILFDVLEEVHKRYKKKNTS